MATVSCSNDFLAEVKFARVIGKHLESVRRFRQKVVNGD